VSVIPSALPSAGRGKSTVTIFGRQVSTDALLLAGASVVAVVLLYRLGRPNTQPTPALAGDGATLATPSNPSNPLIASSPPPPPSPSPWVPPGIPSSPPGIFIAPPPGGFRFPLLTQPGAPVAPWLSPSNPLIASSPAAGSGGRTFLSDQPGYLGSQYWVRGAHLSSAAGM
jgi:hypothetical protein